jgi:2-polyprenyl-6-methoxyphenol hydroxylase-like FAD-dependent oxidoreductase
MTLSDLPRYDADAVSTLGQRAVVVGASVAGLCAARVLEDAYEEVVILERDDLPAGPAIRDGAPQTSQPHSMLEAGRATLEAFFPGFERAVLDAGGLRLDMSRDVVWYDKGGPVAPSETDLPALHASRALFEHVLRERVRGRDGIRIRDGCHLIALTHDEAAGRVTGVRFRDERGRETTMDADLTVDATGKASRTPRWLADHGYPDPEEERVEVGITYSTVRIDRPEDARRGLLIAPEPDRPRGAAMLPVEGGRWEVLLQGLHGERSPRDPDTFLKWADELPLDDIATRLREQTWRSDIQQYPFPASVRRRYDRLSRYPDGLVVTGDAVASFNPIYGQGMSVAALDALALHAAMRDGTAALAPRFFDRVADVVDEAWGTAVRSDFVFERTTGPKPFATDLLNGYVDRLVRRSHDDGRLTEAFLRVFRMERPATSLLRPGVLWRVFRPRFGPLG